MDLFEQLGKKISDAGIGVAKQTRNLTDTTRLNVKIAENKKKMARLFSELGNDYFNKHKNDPNCEEKVYIDQLNVLLREIQAYQKEIDEINAYETCNMCGCRVAADATFCTSCGAKVIKVNVEDKKDNFQSIRKCPICDAPVDKNSLFCRNCGKKLDSDVAINPYDVG